MTIYYTADAIFTGEDETSFVTAFAVRDGEFSWVGSATEVPADADPVRLDGPVLPGLLDVHTHATYVAMLVNSVPCTVPVVVDIPSLIEALRNHPDVGAGPDAWIEGWGYDESKLAEGRTPTRHDLDRVSTEQPVYVLRSDCHSGICNTRALELAGITADTPDPQGAAFGREADGRTPNGVLTEHHANQAVMQAKGSAVRRPTAPHVCRPRPLRGPRRGGAQLGHPGDDVVGPGRRVHVDPRGGEPGGSSPAPGSRGSRSTRGPAPADST